MGFLVSAMGRLQALSSVFGNTANLKEDALNKKNLVRGGIDFSGNIQQVSVVKERASNQAWVEKQSAILERVTKTRQTVRDATAAIVGGKPSAGGGSAVVPAVAATASKSTAAEVNWDEMDDEDDTPFGAATITGNIDDY